jgi:biofilm PGA synthesis lipoprotein PgaB
MLPSQIIAGEALPERAVLITFDDGYASNYRLLLPILQEFNAKVVVSIITKRVTDADPDFLTWDMCREMAATGLVEFGSHTNDLHNESPRGVKRLRGESQANYEKRVFDDLQTSIDLIESNVGVTVQFFAYPHGQTERWCRDFLRSHFGMTVTTHHGAADISGGLYDLNRMNISMSDPPSKFLPD